MNPMKEMLDVADEYAQQSTWADFALIKTSMCAVGIIIGLGVPEDKRKAVCAGAAVVFAVTCVPIMVKMLPILKGHLEKE